MVRAVHRDDGADLDAGAAQVDDELAEAGVPVLRVHRRGADQRDERMRQVRPDVQTLVPDSDQPPSTRSARVRTLARSEPESGSLIPMREETLPAHDPRQELRLLFFRTVFEQRGHDLPVGDPVRGDGRAGGQQFLGDDEPLQERAPVPAVFDRHRHAQPAARRERRR